MKKSDEKRQRGINLHFVQEVVKDFFVVTAFVLPIPSVDWFHEIKKHTFHWWRVKPELPTVLSSDFNFLVLRIPRRHFDALLESTR